MATGTQPRLFGVLGDPVDHSLSPAMQNAAFAAAGLPHVYLRYHVPATALPGALREAARLGMGGLNLTVPLKEVALALCDRLTPHAARSGSVNTVWWCGGKLVGDDTDGRGFLRAVAGRVRVRGTHVVLLGAGGSARAVGTALVEAGCGRVTIANRTPARAARLAARLEALGARTAAVGLDAVAGDRVLGDATLVVNTTPLGLAGKSLRVRHAATPRGALFVDLVYGAEPTPFLVAATRAGRATLDGAAMLLHQGALAFEAWTGRHAPLAAMRRALASAGLALTEPPRARTVRAPRPPRR